jgi:hypothetical protein
MARKKSPPKEKNPARANLESNHFNHVTKEQLAKWGRENGKKGGRPRGVPDGYSKETIKPARAQAKLDSQKVVELMSDKLETEFEREALSTAVEIMRTDGGNRERLQAARLILDFTRSKPATKSDVSISRAEDFLTSLLEESNGLETETSKEETTH